MASFEQDEPSSDESEDNASGVGGYLTQSLSRWRFDRSSDTPLDLWEPVNGPVRAGQELLYSGDFGVVRELLTQPWTAKYGAIASQIARRKTLSRPSSKFQLAYPLLPNSRGVLVAQYPAPCYSGQYSTGGFQQANADSSFFYTCTRDMRVHVSRDLYSLRSMIQPLPLVPVLRQYGIRATLAKGITITLNK